MEGARESPARRGPARRSGEGYGLGSDPCDPRPQPIDVPGFKLGFAIVQIVAESGHLGVELLADRPCEGRDQIAGIEDDARLHLRPHLRGRRERAASDRIDPALPGPQADRNQPVAILGFDLRRPTQVDEGAVFDDVAAGPSLRRYQRVRRDVGNGAAGLEQGQIVFGSAFDVNPDEAGAAISSGFLGRDGAGGAVAGKDGEAVHA